VQTLVIGDVHANLAATEAVFTAADDQGVHEAWCLGDLVGYAKSPMRSSPSFVAGARSSSPAITTSR